MVHPDFVTSRKRRHVNALLLENVVRDQEDILSAATPMAKPALFATAEDAHTSSQLLASTHVVLVLIAWQGSDASVTATAGVMEGAPDESFTRYFLSSDISFVSIGSIAQTAAGRERITCGPRDAASERALPLGRHGAHT